jgi:hypothetical protein
VARFIHQDALRLRAAAIKPQHIAHGKSIREPGGFWGGEGEKRAENVAVAPAARIAFLTHRNAATILVTLRTAA